MENHSPKKSNSTKKEKLYFLIPIIILVFIALASWSWLILLSPAVSSYAEPYINKYFKNLINPNIADITQEKKETTVTSADETVDNKKINNNQESVATNTEFTDI
jgi:heme/copper-type cytochrome/quinol oxidase subunit 2